MLSPNSKRKRDEGEQHDAMDVTTTAAVPLTLGIGHSGMSSNADQEVGRANGIGSQSRPSQNDDLVLQEETSSSGSSDDDDDDDEEMDSSDEEDHDNNDQHPTTHHQLDLPDEDEPPVPIRPAIRKPLMTPLPSSDLHSRISSFLPQLRAANAALLQQQASTSSSSARLDDVSDSEETYIEMNLGLGVLKHVRQRPEGIQTTMEDESSNSDEDDEDEDEPDLDQNDVNGNGRRQHPDAVQKGLGARKSKPGIEEVGNGG